MVGRRSGLIEAKWNSLPTDKKDLHAEPAIHSPANVKCRHSPPFSYGICFVVVFSYSRTLWSKR